MILAAGMLKFAVPGDPVVSFSRSAEIAAYWATLPRDDDEGSGAIFVFDRPSLRTRYKLECYDYAWCKDWQAIDEFEERVVERDVELGPHMIGLMASPIFRLSPTARALARNERIEKAAQRAALSL
jgi:hypothetical protein